MKPHSHANFGWAPVLSLLGSNLYLCKPSPTCLYSEVPPPQNCHWIQLAWALPSCSTCQICSTSNLWPHINYKPTNLNFIVPNTVTSSWHNYVNQGDTVGSAWILNFQPMRRYYIMRRCETNACQASFCTQPVVEQSWVLVQARPCLQAETFCRKMIWTGAITMWAYGLQMSALGYIFWLLRLYQRSHQTSMWSDWLKDALFHSVYVCKWRMLKLYSLATPG